MIQIFNPSRLTRQPFFIDLVDYLDQHDDVILREIKGPLLFSIAMVPDRKSVV